MLEAAASQASSIKQMLVKKKKKEIIILLSTGIIESSLLKPFPEALRIQCAKQSAGKSFASWGTVTNSAALAFTIPTIFLQILNQLLRDFTGQYDITLLFHQ